MLVAPASAQACRIASTCFGLSLMPGISGAIRTLVGIPARFSSATASMRLRGCGVCGSLARHGFSSSVGIDRFAWMSVTAAISFISSRSRSSSGDFVSTEQGLRKSRIASQIPGISRYLDSHHWYGSVFVPIAMCSRFHDGLRNSARSTSGTFTFTTISRSKSRPAFHPRYTCVGRAKQKLQEWVHPRYGFMVYRNGMRDAAGTLLIADFA